MARLSVIEPGREHESEKIAVHVCEKLTILRRLKFTVNLIKFIKSELIGVNVN